MGVGIRVISGERTGYAYSDDLSPEKIRKAARVAAHIASGPSKVEKFDLNEGVRHNLYPVLTAPTETAFAERVELVKRADSAARAYDPRIFQVQAAYADNLRHVMVATSEGVLTLDRQPLARLSVSALARQNGGPPQRGHAGGGGRVELDFFLKEKTPEHFATDAAREAIAMLDAVEAPAGEMTVVLGPGWPGILLHEAVGHGLEADFNRKGVSAFSGRLGQKVASELCTVIDDGTIGSRRGSLNVDDEGHATRRNVLIENGVLRGYLQDKLSSTLLQYRIDRQRPARELRPHPDAAYDEHLYGGGGKRPGRHHPLGAEGPVLRELRRWAGGHHQRQFRLLRLRELPDRRREADPAGPQRHADRERAGGPEVRQHGRQRSAAGRRHRDLRQGRTERACRRGYPDDQDRSDDGRGHRLGRGGQPPPKRLLVPEPRVAPYNPYIKVNFLAFPDPTMIVANSRSVLSGEPKWESPRFSSTYNCSTS